MTEKRRNKGEEINKQRCCLRQRQDLTLTREEMELRGESETSEVALSQGTDVYPDSSAHL